MGFRRASFSLAFTLLMLAYALVVPPTAVAGLSSQVTTMLPYHSRRDESRPKVHSFGATLEPRYIFRAGALDQ